MTRDSSPIDWAQFEPILRDSHCFVITSHVRPDCDALGSELAMAALLRALGKEVRIINADATPPRLSFIDPQQRIEVLGRDVQVEDLTACEVFLIVDTSAWRQLGRMAEVIRDCTQQVVVIDHHASDGEVPALLLMKDAEAEATGRLVYELIRYLQVPLTREMADAIFAAIATDTGWFRFPSTTGGTFRVVADLVEHGVQPGEIYRQLYERDSLSRSRLRALVLSRLETEQAGKLAHTFVQAADFAQTGALPSETEDFVNMALAVDGTEVAVMMTEHPAGSVKVSLRSRGSIDCSRLASDFGGGGHKAAAGATLTGPLNTVQQQVLDVVRQAMSAGSVA